MMEGSGKIFKKVKICRFGNELLQRGEQDLSRGEPPKRAQGEGVVMALPDGKLLLEVLKRKELMRGVKSLVILAAAAQPMQSSLKKGLLV